MTTQESFKIAYQAVIFDWGGVLIDAPTLPLKQSCAEQLGTTLDIFDPLFQPFVDDFYRGLVDESEIWSSIATQLNLPIPSHSVWGQAFKQTYSPKKAMFDMMFQLKEQGQKLGFLSNTEKAAVRFFKAQNYDFFDATVFSCDEGLSKPGAEIYHLALKRLNIQAQEAIFIDDRIENIEGCEAIGMTGVLFQNEAQVRQELIQLGALKP